MIRRLVLALMAAMMALVLAFAFGAPLGFPSLTLASDSGPPGETLLVEKEVPLLLMSRPPTTTCAENATCAENEATPATVLLI